MYNGKYLGILSQFSDILGKDLCFINGEDEPTQKYLNPPLTKKILK